MTVDKGGPNEEDETWILISVSNTASLFSLKPELNNIQNITKAIHVIDKIFKSNHHDFAVPSCRLIFPMCPL